MKFKMNQNYKVMKKITITLLPALFIIGTFSGCHQDESVNGPAVSDLQDAQNEAVSESVFEDLDDVTYYGELSVSADGRVAKDDESPANCASIYKDDTEKIITIDFGDGCQDKFGRMRSGKIMIAYTGHFSMPGAQRAVTFENYAVDSIQVEGVYTKTNISESTNDTLKYEVKLEGGKLTWPDGSFVTRDANWLNKRVRALNPINDIRIHDGSAHGTTRTGNNYTVQITKPILWMRGCLPYKRVFIPVEGVKVKSIEGGPNVTIDWGNGECDNLYSVTKDGITREIEIKDMRGRN